MMQTLRTIVVTAVAVFAVTAVATAGATRVVGGRGDTGSHSSAAPAGITLSEAQFVGLIDAIAAGTDARGGDRRSDGERERPGHRAGGDVRHGADVPGHGGSDRAGVTTNDRASTECVRGDATPEHVGGTREAARQHSSSHDGGSQQGGESHH